MLKVLDFQVVLDEPEYSNEIDRILDADPMIYSKIHINDYGLYVDRYSTRAIFEDENDKILIDTNEMPSYNIQWNDYEGWVIAQ